jgi:formylglycine-generating enzyme required for sulfatase activity
MTIAASGCVLSAMHWQHSIQALEKAKSEYEAAQARYAKAFSDEKPAHPVTLTQPFYMGKFTVTQEQYEELIGENPSHFKGKDNPVESVSWDDAQAFCKKLSHQTNQTVQLPTEAEWEYACRAGTMTMYHSDDTESDLDRVAWYGKNSKNTTHPVGQKEANAFGLYDMHGNVLHWCKDWYGADYYKKSVAENPQGPDQGTYRVLRGGSWDYSLRHYLWVAYTISIPDNREVRFGFRVVLRVPPKTP